MSFRLEMLQVARVAPKLLGESAGLVADFLRSRLHPEGGFLDRGGRPDLYYTVFGLEGLSALQESVPLEPTRAWLAGYGDGEGLDFRVRIAQRVVVAAAQLDELDSGPASLLESPAV